MMILAQQPSIFPFGIRIDQPITTATDVLVAIVCFYAFFRLMRIPSQHRIKTYLLLYFMGMGIATFIGGVIGHGFLYAFSFAWKLPGWISSMLAVMLIERAAIEHAVKITTPKAITIFKWVNITELLTFMTLTFVSLNFRFVEIHSAYGIMFIVGSYSVYTYWKSKSKASKIFIGAVAFAVVSSIIYLQEWSIDIWFNYLDASHTLMAVAAFIFYKGSIQMLKENP
ncbi:MAG: hypothetical protein U9N51_09350 [Bacteroidota bacterium]|nr:hypothetical protein [Bacteroidota bacterium]